MAGQQRASFALASPSTRVQQGGGQLEHHGLRRADLRDWCESTGILENVEVDRIPFRMQEGEQGNFGVGEGFTLLALTCTREAGGRSARNSICEP